eukprot:1124703-Prorocentrum_lima.AAC.1
MPGSAHRARTRASRPLVRSESSSSQRCFGRVEDVGSCGAPHRPGKDTGAACQVCGQRFGRSHRR